MKYNRNRTGRGNKGEAVRIIGNNERNRYLEKYARAGHVGRNYPETQRLKSRQPARNYPETQRPKSRQPARNYPEMQRLKSRRPARNYPEMQHLKSRQPVREYPAYQRRTSRPDIPRNRQDMVISWQDRRLRKRRKRRIARLKRAGILLALGIVGIALISKAVGSVGRWRADAAAADAQKHLWANMITELPGEMSTVNNDSEEQLIQGIKAEDFERHPEWTEDFLTPNEYSRPGDPLEQVNNIFVHYTANPGTSAAQNRSYFEQQKDMHEASVSSHFIIGYNGEILQIVPLDEIAYAVQTRNQDSISIECCYKAQNGQFTQETYDSLIALLAWLIDVYELDSEDILRHYDCGGKKCPLYYVEHEDAWEILKRDVEEK